MSPHAESGDGGAPRPAKSRLGGPRRSLGILAKWVSLIVAVVSLAVTALAIYFPNRQHRELEKDLEQRAETYARLLDRELKPAVAFEDRETAREVFRAVAEDPLVSGLGLYVAGGVLAEQGHVTGVARISGLSLQEKRVYRLPDRVLVVEPVQSLEGPRGTLVLELSKASLERSHRELTRTALLAGAVVLLLATIVAFFVARSMARRVRSIARAATAVAGGRFSDEGVPEDSSDEIGSLGRAFNAMVSQLKALIDQIRQQAHEEQARLETLVRVRTEELSAKNQDLRLVMDNVDQGFVTIDREGRLSDERSRRIETWFGRPSPGQTLWGYLDAVSPGFGERVQLGFDQLLEGVLPVEVALDQIPSQFEVGGRHHTIALHPIASPSGGIENALVVINDTTALVERERSDEDRRETVSLVMKLVSDHPGLEAFLAEARETMAKIERRPADQAEFSRAVHTLKGNASMFGLTALVAACHRLEGQLAEGESPASVSLAGLANAFRRVEAKLVPLLEGYSVAGPRIHSEDLDDLVLAIRDNSPHAVLEQIVESWSFDRVDVRLGRAADQVKDLAARLGKGPVAVFVESDRIRVESEHWRPFWAELGHVLRNLVDHGIESPEERKTLGKPATAPVHLRAFTRAGDLVIQVEDHGRGIAWDEIRDRALRLGVITRKDSPRSDLVAALFREGLTTAEEVTHTSGRGIGLAAVRAAVVRHGGRVEVESEPGRGTCFSFIWPIEAQRNPFAFALPHARPERGKPLS